MATNALVRLLLDNSQFISKLTDSKKGMQGLASSIASFAGKLGVVTSASELLSQAITNNISTAMTFEKSMSSLSALTGMTGEKLDYLKQKAIELGGTSTQTASQVAESFMLIGSKMPDLLQDADALNDVTKAAITLAEASGDDVTTSANALTASLNIMGEGADQASRYINVLAAGSQKGNRNIQELTDIVFRCGQQARATGLSFEDLIAVAAAGTKEFSSAEMAGQGLAKLFLQLEKQGDDQLKPSVVGLSTAIQNLTEKNFSLTEATSLFTKNGAAAYMSIIHNKDAILQTLPAITGTNTATEQAATNTDNLQGSLNKLSSAWEQLNLSINSGNGILKEAVDDVTAVVGVFNSLGSAMQNLPSWVSSAASALRTAAINMNTNLSAVLTTINLIRSGLNWIKEHQNNNTPSSVDPNTGAKVGAIIQKVIGGKSGKGKSNEEVYDDSTDAGIRKHIKALKAERDAVDKTSQEYANLTAEITRLQSLLKPTTPKIPTGQTEAQRKAERLNESIQRSWRAMRAAPSEDAIADAPHADKYTEAFNRQKDLYNAAGLATPMMGEQLYGLPEFQTDSIDAYNQKLRELNELLNTLTIGSDAYNAVAEQINSTQNELNVKKSKTMGDNSGKMADNFASAASAISQCTSAMAEFGGTGVNVAATIAGAVATIAAAYAQNLAGDTTTKGNIWAFIGAAASATISMAATIASLHKATGYAEGGVVSGSSYEGDKLWGRLNSGEVVLSQSQAARANAALDGATGGHGYVSGENIYIGLNNFGRRTGKGELVFSKR